MIRDTLADAIRTALDEIGIDPLPESIALERPARREHGDWSTNVALASAKAAGRNPRELAGELVERLEAAPPEGVTAIEIAGPGFVNFHLADTELHDQLRAVVAAGLEDYARHDFGAGTSVDVEFVSANPNKPLHAGHARGACLGDSIARLLDRCGYAVTKECYLNDRGVQMQLFAESLAARKAGEEPPADGYQGAYVAEWAAEMPDDADPLEWGYARAVQSHKDTLARLDIHHDVWFSERSMVASGAIDDTLADLADHGAMFEADGAAWIRSSEHGDDKDRVLVKSDGELTYLAPDITYHRDKFSRADRLINVWGADHHGYIERLKSAMAWLGHEPDELEILVTQLVDLRRGGEEVRMSGRAGDLVEFDEIIDLLGPDSTRFAYLMQTPDTRLTIDVEVMTAQAMENPVFYVQYANARIHQLMAKAEEAGVQRRPIAEVDLGLLVDEQEHALIRRLALLPEVVERAGRDRAPHKVITWLRELAGDFHRFYHDCRVVGVEVDPELTQARLWLVEASRIALLIGLGLVGVSAPDSM